MFIHNRIKTTDERGRWRCALFTGIFLMSPLGAATGQIRPSAEQMEVLRQQELEQARVREDARFEAELAKLS